MKSLFLGIAFILLVGIGGLVYRNAVEYPMRPITCPIDALTCPDGTRIPRTGNSCTFSECLPPNVSLPESGIAFALPDGYGEVSLPDEASIAAYASATGDNSFANIVIRKYAINASSTALATIQETAISGTSGLPVGATAYSSKVLGRYRFTRVAIERFEGVVVTAYYLTRDKYVLRFDAIDREVSDWTDPALDINELPVQIALEKLLTTLQGK